MYYFQTKQHAQSIDKSNRLIEKSTILYNFHMFWDSAIIEKLSVKASIHFING